MLAASREQVDGSDWLTFDVSDTGIGMSEDQMNKVFDDFTQAEAETTAKFGGTGLGLSITRQLVEMMGGEVTVTSAVGEGSTFSIRVPSTVPDTDEPESSEGSAGPDAAPEGEGKVVLIIDDEPSAHDILKRKLAGSAYQLVSAMDGNQGLALAREVKPDLILLDILMPDKDGWTVLGELKDLDETRDIPIIVVSMMDDDHSAVSLGADAFMTKPVDRDQLIVKIESIFGQSLAGRRALVVDDDAQARDILSRTLTQCGLDVEEAENGAIAFGKVSEGYDLVILDLSMPVMDGFEFLARLDDLGLSKKPEIIVFSAMHLDETMRARLEGSCVDVLNKTEVNSETELVASISRHLARVHTVLKKSVTTFILSTTSRFFPYLLIIGLTSFVVLIGMNAYFFGLFSAEALAAEESTMCSVVVSLIRSGGLSSICLILGRFLKITGRPFSSCYLRCSIP